MAVEPAPAARREFLAAHGLHDDPASVADPLLAVAADAWRTMMEHARSAPVEVGGLLVGEVFRDEDGRLLVDVLVAIPAVGALQEAAYFRLTEAAWEHISRERAALHPDLLTVGWYHTHPGLGVFFSGTDRASQRAFFNRPWNVGLVIDPDRDEVALFRGEDSERLSVEHLAVYAGDVAAQTRGGGAAVGQAFDRWRGWRDESRPLGARDGAGAPPVAAASPPAADAGARPRDAGSEEAAGSPAPPAAPNRPALPHPAPLAVPWAPIAALAGAVVSFALALRAGTRLRRSLR